METRLPSKFVQAAFAAAILSLLSGAAGAQAPSWSLTGNAGTDPLTNFLGTKDGKPLVIQPGSGNVNIGPVVDPAIPYAKFTVTGATSDRAAGEHARPVALTGRVYVFADASHDPIQPGDLLTTADTPGHAMKVTNYGRAQGAVLGKAMSALPAGKGLVLVSRPLPPSALSRRRQTPGMLKIAL